MSGEDNIKTIQRVYEAFGAGDVPTIIEALHEDVDWAADAASTTAPWYGVKHGPAEVLTFFQRVGEAVEVLEFNPVAFAANDTDVLTVVQYRSRIRATGVESAMNLHHYFRFRDGKVVYYRGSEDTEATAAAIRG